jgi:hypothetical protein
MKLSNIFTSKWLSIDSRVVVTMLTVSVCCMGLLAYKMKTDYECNEIIITVSSLTNHKNHNFFTGELVHFSAPMEGDNEVVWDFGDESEKTTGGSVTHVFKSEGDYTIEVLVNGRCTGTESLSIKKFDAKKDSSSYISNTVIRDLNNPINAESFIIEQGKQLLFWSNMPATAYEWSIMEDKTQLHKISDKASFNFQKAGNYTIKLVLNNDPNSSWTRNITVNPRKDISIVGTVKPYSPNPIVTPTPLPIPTPDRSEKKPENQVNPNIPEKKVEPTKDPNPVKPEDNNSEKIVRDIFQDDADWVIMLQSLIKGTSRLDEFKPHIHDFDSKIILANGESLSFVELISRLQKDKKLDEKSITIQQEYDSKQKKLKRLIVSYKRKKGILGL